VGRADNLTTFMCHLSRNSGGLNLLEPLACHGMYRKCFALQKMYKVKKCKEGTPTRLGLILCQKLLKNFYVFFCRRPKSEVLSVLRNTPHLFWCQWFAIHSLLFETFTLDNILEYLSVFYGTTFTITSVQVFQFRSL
jgi:hypothetical protein